MDGFNPLETAALRDICTRFPEDRVVLETQLTSAEVTARENTGAGFYTRFGVSHDGAALAGERLRSGGWARVDGFKNPVGFILWLAGGYADCLEGFTIDDSTAGLDFSTVGFDMMAGDS